MTFRLPEGHWVIITIFIVSQANAGASVTKATQRLAGTLAGAGVGILVNVAFPQEPWFRVPLLGGLCALGLYLSRTTTAPYVGFLAVVTMLLVIGGVDPDPVHQLTLGLWRCLDVSLGIVLGTGAQLLLWPRDPEALLRSEGARVLDDSQAVLGRLLAPAAAGTHAGSAVIRLREAALNGLSSQLDLLSHAEARYPRLRYRHTELLVMISAVNRLASASTALELLVSSSLAAVIQSPAGADLRAAMAAVHDEMRCLRQAFPGKRPVAPEEALAASALAAAAGASPQLAPVRLTLIELQAALEQLRTALAYLAASSVPGEALPPNLRSPLDSDKPVGPLTPRFWELDADDVHFAAKGALAAVLSYVLINALDWQGGLGAVVTCPIVAQSSVGAVLHKAALRLAGALLGGMLALFTILVIVPNVTGLAALLAVTSLCFAAAAYVTAGSARISYAGVQIAMAFAIGVLDTPSPSVNLAPAFGRVLSVLTGNIVTAVIFAWVWPVFAADQLRSTITAALRSMAQLARLGLSDTPEASRPARGYRWQIFQDFGTALQLSSESTFEGRGHGSGTARHAALLAVLHEAQTVTLLILAVVRHRLNVRLADAPAALRNSSRALALAIAELLEAAAARLDGTAAVVAPDLRDLLAGADTTLLAPEATAALDGAQRTALVRLRDQLELYRDLLPHLAELERQASIAGAAMAAASERRRRRTGEELA